MNNTTTIPPLQLQKCPVSCSKDCSRLWTNTLTGHRLVCCCGCHGDGKTTPSLSTNDNPTGETGLEETGAHLTAVGRSNQSQMAANLRSSRQVVESAVISGIVLSLRIKHCSLLQADISRIKSVLATTGKEVPA
jgi:hypothetical protein